LTIRESWSVQDESPALAMSQGLDALLTPSELSDLGNLAIALSKAFELDREIVYLSLLSFYRREVKPLIEAGNDPAKWTSPVLVDKSPEGYYRYRREYWPNYCSYCGDKFPSFTKRLFEKHIAWCKDHPK